MATLAILAVAAISGVMIGIANTMAALIILGALILAASFFVPLRLMFWVLIVTTFVLYGPTQYFGRIGKAFWLPYLLGLLVLVRAATASRNTPRPDPHRKHSALWLEWSLVLLGAILGASTLINLSPILQVLLAAKEYFFLWGVWFLILAGTVETKAVDRIWHSVPAFLLLQLPVVAYQRFVIATSRSGGASWDAVVGLFGGDPDGGGASGTMAMCAVIGLAFLVTHWRRGLVSTWRLLLTGALVLATIMMAEVKFAIVLLPVSMILIYWRDLARRPVRSMGMMSVAVVASFAIGYAYQTQYTTTATKAGQSAEGYIDYAVSANASTNFIDPVTRQIGRIAALQFWWDEQQLDDPLHIAIGYGIGASRMGQRNGEVAQRYNFDIERSSLAVILWEAGLLGAITLIAALASGILGAFRLARQAIEPSDAAVLQACGVGLSIALLSLPYGPDLILVPQFQLAVILMLGRVAVVARRGESRTGLIMRRSKP